MSLSKSTEITGSNRSKSFSTPGHSPQLVTPINTPPHPSFAEQRLQQLLMNCEAGTHSFHRDDGDDYTPSGPSAIAGPVAGVAGDMRRKSFAGGEGMFHPLVSVTAYIDIFSLGTTETRSTTFFPLFPKSQSTIWLYILSAQFTCNSSESPP
jgi:hypothetical protein